MSVDTNAPTVYPDMSEKEYHAHPALSSHGARDLLRSPRHYRHARDHPIHRDVFDIGTAAHTMILGVGPQIDVVDATSWRSKDAAAAREAAREVGRTPVLAADYERLRDMKVAVEAHPAAAALLANQSLIEASLFWTDPETGAPCKARPDLLADDVTTVVDLKTADNGSAGVFRAAAARYGYPQQAAWYCDAVAHVFDSREARFVWVVVEKEPPHGVAVYVADQLDLEVGHELNMRARERYVEALRSDSWPAYSTQIEPLQMPRWYGRD